LSASGAYVYKQEAPHPPPPHPHLFPVIGSNELKKRTWKTKEQSQKELKKIEPEASVLPTTLPLTESEQQYLR
jgi:hypothetical protein